MGNMLSTVNPTNWILEITKISIPVVLGVLVWALQALAQRAWTEYERHRDLYLEVVRAIDALLSETGTEDRKRYRLAIRSVWMGGSDEVVRAANRLSASIKANTSGEELNTAYQGFIVKMRTDLQTRRWLPPGRTSLTEADFPVEGPR
jgi:hypothetical protein